MVVFGSVEGVIRVCLREELLKQSERGSIEVYHADPWLVPRGLYDISDEDVEYYSWD